MIGIRASWYGKLPFSSHMSQISEGYNEYSSGGVQKNTEEVNLYEACCYGIDQRVADRNSPLTVLLGVRVWQ